MDKSAETEETDKPAGPAPRPCARQHFPVMRHSNYACVQCSRERSRLRRQTCKDEIKAQKKRARPRRAASGATAAYKRRWRAKYPAQKRAERAKERADKINRTPAWADLAAIRTIYRDIPPGHHVDHFYPLCGLRVSGLHVAANLRYLPALDNIRKGAKMPATLESL